MSNLELKQLYLSKHGFELLQSVPKAQDSWHFITGEMLISPLFPLVQRNQSERAETPTPNIQAYEIQASTSLNSARHRITWAGFPWHSLLIQGPLPYFFHPRVGMYQATQRHLIFLGSSPCYVIFSKTSQGECFPRISNCTSNMKSYTLLPSTPCLSIPFQICLSSHKYSTICALFPSNKRSQNQFA